jgi:hypothetical protein
MQTEEYLSQLKNIDNRIKDLMKEADKWFDIATSTGGIDYSADKVQTSPKPDRIGDLVGKVVDYQERCKRLAADKIELKHTIIEQIRSLSGEEMYYNILYGRYVENKSLNRLAVENEYSNRRIKGLHKKAIEDFEKTYGTLYLDNPKERKKA